MSLSDSGKAALIYWNNIQEAVTSRATTSDLWSAIRDSAAAMGFDRPGVTLQGVNELRSYAARIRNSGEALGSAEASEGLRDNLLSEAPWSRGLDERNLSPMLQVRFQLLTIEDGVLQSNWRTIVHSGNHPRTVGDLHNIVHQDAQSLADSYGVDYQGFSDLSALVI